MRRRVLAGSGTIYKIPNGVYEVAIDSTQGGGNYLFYLYKGSDIQRGLVPRNHKLTGILFIKETISNSPCGFLVISPVSEEVQLFTGNQIAEYTGRYYNHYHGFADSEDVAHQNRASNEINSNYYSNSEQGDTLTQILYNMYNGSGNAMYNYRYEYSAGRIEYNGFRVPTVGELDMIRNRWDDIFTYAGTWENVDLSFLSNWDMHTITAESSGLIWRYAFGDGIGREDGSQVNGMITGRYSPSTYAHVIYIKMPMIKDKESNINPKRPIPLFFYKGVVLTEETWGTDDIGYLPGQS